MACLPLLNFLKKLKFFCVSRCSFCMYICAPQASTQCPEDRVKSARNWSAGTPGRATSALSNSFLLLLLSLKTNTIIHNVFFFKCVYLLIYFVVLTRTLTLWLSLAWNLCPTPTPLSPQVLGLQVCPCASAVENVPFTQTQR